LISRLRNEENQAISQLDAAQLEDELTIARILGTHSASVIGQQLQTGVQRLSRQIASIQRARMNIRDMDAIL